MNVIQWPAEVEQLRRDAELADATGDLGSSYQLLQAARDRLVAGPPSFDRRMAFAEVMANRLFVGARIALRLSNEQAAIDQLTDAMTWLGIVASGITPDLVNTPRARERRGVTIQQVNYAHGVYGRAVGLEARVATALAIKLGRLAQGATADVDAVLRPIMMAGHASALYTEAYRHLMETGTVDSDMLIFTSAALRNAVISEAGRDTLDIWRTRQEQYLARLHGVTPEAEFLQMQSKLGQQETFLRLGGIAAITAAALREP